MVKRKAKQSASVVPASVRRSRRVSDLSIHCGLRCIADYCVVYLEYEFERDAIRTSVSMFEPPSTSTNLNAMKFVLLNQCLNHRVRI